MNSIAGPAGPHCVSFRVYYEDTDAGGIVYHASYLRFAERARTEMLRQLGFEQTRLRQWKGILLTVRRLCIDYDRPAGLDDLLAVRSRVLEVRGARIELEQVVCRGDTVLARLAVSIVAVGEGGRPKRIPDELRHALRTIEQSA